MPARLPTLLLSITAFGCSGKDADSGGSDTGWLASLQDLGAPRASSADLDVAAQADDLWFTSAHFLPGIDWDEPTVDIPLFLFETVAMQDAVADSGSCPYTVLEGGQTTWESDCRSTNGYEWTGRMVQTRWTEGDRDYTRWDADLDIIGDTDRAEFDQLTLAGAVVYVRGSDGPLKTAIQGNMQVQLSGLWSRADADDPRESDWRDWAWTGRDELTDAGHRIDGVARVGGIGTVALTAQELTVDPACGSSPTGTVTAQGSGSVDLGFHGSTDCRQCADLTGPDGPVGETCAR
jgi:hypothetical protein